MRINQKMKYYVIAVFVIWPVLCTGLALAGTLTVSLEPSLDGKEGDIRATSITKAEWFVPDGQFIVGGLTYKLATITNGTAEFNLSDRDAGDSFILINDLTDDPVPMRIDDPTTDIHQFVGKKLWVSVIGNLSDPTHLIKTFSKGQGRRPAIRNINESSFPFDSVYIILSLKTNPQKLEIKGIDITLKEPVVRINDFTPIVHIHPNTSTSFNSPFSKWVFRHGNDYGGNDSKCNSCHGNLDTQEDLPIITVNNGFCFRCHYGKSGTDAGFTVRMNTQLHAFIFTPTPAAAPKTPAFEALSAIAALLIVLRLLRIKI